MKHQKTRTEFEAWKRRCELMLAILLMCCTVGCQHQRVCEMVMVDDLGPQIATKNKYKLVNFIHGRTKAVDINEMKMPAGNDWLDEANRILKESYPQIFGDDGIPFVLHIELLLPENRSSPAGLNLLMGTMSLEYKRPWNYTVDVLDNPGARTTFKEYKRIDTAFTFLIPLPIPFLCYLGEASFPRKGKGSRTLTHHSMGFVNGRWNTYTGCGIIEYGDKIEEPIWTTYVDNIVAYGIAVKLKQMEDAGLIDVSRIKPSQKDDSSIDTVNDFDLTEFRRKEGSAHEYVFVLKSRHRDVSIRQARSIQKELKMMISNDFASSFPNANRAVLVVDFPEYALEDNLIRGQATVIPLDIMALDYDKNTRTGIMKIRVASGQLEEARNYLRRNIESVVVDKNIALIAGKIPLAANYILLNEALGNGILEIKFKAE